MGRTVGSLSGFNLRNHKWRVAFAAVMALTTIGRASNKKATLLVWLALVDLEMVRNRVSATAEQNGRLKLRINPLVTTLESGHIRAALPMNDADGNWISLDDFRRTMRRMTKAADRSGLTERDAIWLIELGTFFILALFGTDEDLRLSGRLAVEIMGKGAIQPDLASLIQK